MKKHFHTFWISLLLFVATVSASAQAPPGWGWVNQLGTYAYSPSNANGVAGLGRDAAGNLYVFGTYVGAPVLSGVPTTSQGDGDMFLAKYTPAGALVWLRTLQSSGRDQAAALCVEPSGRCTLAGSYSGQTGGNLSFSNFNSPTILPGAAILGLPTAGGFYQALPFVAAVDAAGTLLWADNPSPTYGLSFKSLHRDSGGNCYVSANTRPQATLIINGQSYPPIGSEDAVLLKYLPAGQAAWVRRLGATSGSTYTGSVKTDAANALYWTVSHNQALTVDGRNVPSMPSALPVERTSNTLFKISANNTVVWAKNSILRTTFGNAQGEVLAIDSQTNALYLQGLGYSAAVTDKAPSLNSLPVPVGASAQCVALCDTSGAVQWIKPVAYATTVPGGSMWAAAPLINFFPSATGYTALVSTAYAAQTVFPGGASFGLGQSGMPCVIRYNYVSNQCDWVRVGGVAYSGLGSYMGSWPAASAIDGAGNLFVTGLFAGTAQFGTTTLQSAVSVQPEIFLAKLDQTILTATKAGVQGRAWSAYPNPTAGTVQLVGLPALAQVQVYDAQGRLVRTLPPVSTADAPRSFSGLAPGLYLLQVSHTAEAYRSQRLLVQ